MMQDLLMTDVPAMFAALGAEALFWGESVIAMGRDKPDLAAALIAFAVAAGIASRRLSLLLTGLLLAAFSISFVSLQPVEMQPFLTWVAVFGQMFLFMGAWTYRRQIQRLKRSAAALSAEKEELRHLLDREIIWRTAASEPKVFQ